MKAPLQIVDQGSDATQAERELIAAGRAVRLPSGKRGRIWASVAAACVATEAGAAAAASAASASASTGTTSGSVLSAIASWKGLALLAVIGGSAATYHATRPRPAEPRAEAAPVVQHAASAQSVSRAEAVMQPQAMPAAPAKAVVKPAPPAVGRATGSRPSRPPVFGDQNDEPSRASTSRLAEESIAVIAARRALRDGDAAACLRLLEEASAAFPHGSLAQEREALTIQALADSGQLDLAKRRATRFLREHPESPHAADLRHIAR